MSTIDLSKIPAPQVVEEISYEDIVINMISMLKDADPVYDAIVESDPAYKIIEVAAYREMILRQRINDAAKSIMLAYAGGSDLDNLGANFNVERLVIKSGNPNAEPPVVKKMENDDDFRHRIQLKLEGITTAGSEQNYIFHALSASGNVKDVSVDSPLPCEITVIVLSRETDGSASIELKALVNDAISGELVRPIGDRVSVESAAIVNYNIEAELQIDDGPDAALVIEEAKEAIDSLVIENQKLGQSISQSAIHSALHREGVNHVNLIQPDFSLSDQIIVQQNEAAFCQTITLRKAP